MRKGFSGATVRVTIRSAVKSFPEHSLDAEARMCMMLYPLTPWVIAVGSDYYEMEILQEPEHTPHWTENAFIDMRQKLELVWARKLPIVNRDWRPLLIKFCETYGYNVAPLIHALLPVSVTEGAQMIHGDPTLANVMFRNEYDLCIVDPIMPNGKIPAMWTVDLGKMLQSCCGWEKVILGWKYDSASCADKVLNNVPMIDARRSWFWCMVHFLRILPYVKSESNAGVMAKNNAKWIYSYLITNKDPMEYLKERQ